ncbi:MAG: hypothetical protein D4R84_17880 [Rhodocyclaceae bacterium]|nr:MAG: hypothetical protein D4R84_17880 [Rhodocyclaceae bacterium]
MTEAINPETGEVTVAGSWGIHGTTAQICALFAALSTAQATMGGAKKDAVNPHLRNKYADLAAYLDAAMPVLSANGLSVVQPVVTEGVVTILGHKDGGYVHSVTPILLGEGKGLNPAQVYGVGSSYARRYGLAGLLSMAAEDSDGAGAGAAKQQTAANSASTAKPAALPATPAAAPASAAAAGTASPPPVATGDSGKDAAIADVRARLVKAGRDEVALCGWLGCETLEAATSLQIDKALAALEPKKKAA